MFNLVGTYFNGGDAVQKLSFIEKINQCTGFVGDSIIDSTAKKAWYVQHIAERTSLLEQAKMLRGCVNAVKAIVTPAQVEVMRKVEMAKFNIKSLQSRLRNIILVIYLLSMMMLGNCWRVWVSRTCRIMRNECGYWTICFSRKRMRNW